MKYTFFIAVIILLSSCEKQNVINEVIDVQQEEPIIAQEQPVLSQNQSKILTDEIIGKWGWVDFEDDLQTFERITEFGETYGFEFENDTDMVEWTSGWCGTPPLSFFKMPTTYTLSDSILEFDTWWEAKYKVVKCSDNELLLEIVRD